MVYGLRFLRDYHTIEMFRGYTPALGGGWAEIGVAYRFRGHQGARPSVSVYKYYALLKRGEEVEEVGTVVAQDESDAKQKLRVLNYRSLKLKKLNVINAFVRRFTADFR